MTPRQQADADVHDALATLQLARGRLRDAVKAEIRALPAIPDTRDFHGIRAVLETVLGPSEEAYRFMEGGRLIWDTRWQSELHEIRLRAPVAGGPARLSAMAGSDEMPPICVDDDGLDAALKATLLFLADRDVFLSTVAK